MSYLSDTNILSELARRKPNAGVLVWADDQTRIKLSVVTLEEILFGLSWKPNPKIQQWFDAFLQRHCDILPITSAIAQCSAEMRGPLKAKGRSHRQADLLIAATAIVHGLTLVTRNEKDFLGCGVALLNPFR